MFRPGDFITFTHSMVDYQTWLTQMETTESQEWKKSHIYDMIMLSKEAMRLDIEHFFGFLDYWFMSINTFIFRGV